MRDRMTRRGRRVRRPTARTARNVHAEIEDLEKRIEAMDEDELLKKETIEIADEESDIAEESTGIRVHEDEDQNAKAMKDWPVPEKDLVAKRLLKLARMILEEE